MDIHTPPRRIVGIREGTSSHGLFGTVVEKADPSEPGMLGVEWLDFPKDGTDEIHENA